MRKRLTTRTKFIRQPLKKANWPRKTCHGAVQEGMKTEKI